LLPIISDGIQTAYEVTAPMLMFAQLLMLLEIVHAVFGLVKSGIMAPLLQVELLILLYCICDANNGLNNLCVV